jgi:hypothetical protein
MATHKGTSFHGVRKSADTARARAPQSAPDYSWTTAFAGDSGAPTPRRCRRPTTFHRSQTPKERASGKALQNKLNQLIFERVHFLSSESGLGIL